MSKQLLLSFLAVSVANDVQTQTRTATVYLGSDEKTNVGGVITPTYTLSVVTDESTAKEMQRIGNLRVEVEDLPVYGALKEDVKEDSAESMQIGTSLKSGGDDASLDAQVDPTPEVKDDVSVVSASTDTSSSDSSSSSAE